MAPVLSVPVPAAPVVSATTIEAVCNFSGPPTLILPILSLPRRTPAAWQLVRNANAGTDRVNTAALADLHRLLEHAIWISAASTWRALPESREAGEYGGRYGWGSCGAALRTLRC
ncbi:hypothetical protein VE02_10218 [Pseudogymnoascus sp. 03VT05]|nr:hypothetical protein VE02_10218 [Pseudogymnoascus sp. 03VT05]